MSGTPTTTSQINVEYVEIEGYDNFSKYWDSLKSTSPPTYFDFTGKKQVDGHSWCPDCVEGKFNILFYKFYVLFGSTGVAGTNL